jgi:hypothetical protein
MSYERDLYWAVRTAQGEGAKVEDFFEEARKTWAYVRQEMTHIENQKLSELAKGRG